MGSYSMGETADPGNYDGRHGRAFAKFAAADGALMGTANTDYHGITSVADTGTGVKTVTLTDALPSTNYPVFATANTASMTCAVTVTDTTTLVVETYNSGDGADADAIVSLYIP